ncbi:glyoxalase [Shimia abyssi]|uniref:glyoxalase n=1 Tax=Shimia abyssi TaxID=1662395 RepID=UPI000D0D3761|nr:glyoxalase [Shimia abyssi]
MDFETVDAGTFGKSLRGIGLNLLVREVPAFCAVLETVFDMKSYQVTKDFAIVTYGDQVFQVHADGTFHSHPLLGLLPEAGARGAGLEIHLYDTDPDEAVRRGRDVGMHVLQEPKDKPHGLRECYLLCDNGYAWVASRPL